MIKPFRIAAGLLIIAIVSVSLSACGSGGAKTTAPQESEAPSVAEVETAEPADAQETVVAAPADTLSETTAQAATESPADTPVETSVDTAEDTTGSAAVEVTSVQDSATLEVNLPEAVPEAGAETESALSTAYADYGFSLKLDLGAEIQAAGWTEPEPSVTQGIISFAYGGVNTNIVWGPPEDRTALTFLADTYNLLRASQRSVTFESISDGDISISEQEGVYGGFKAVDNSGGSIGGGLIGAWVCGDSETAFRMTLTGDNATVVQLRFDRLLENFACSTS
jgi:hypothetical protein